MKQAHTNAKKERRLNLHSEYQIGITTLPVRVRRNRGIYGADSTKERKKDVAQKPRNAGIDYHVTDLNIHVNDSYKIRRCKIFSALNRIERESGKDTIVFDCRSHFSLGMEWSVHNVLYRLGIMRSRTKDADLNYPCEIPEWIYCVIGIICWIFLWFLI